MHGYGVACFTAKCRRRTAAPRRSPFTYSTYPLQTLPLSLFPFPLSSFSSTADRRSLILRPSSYPRPRAPSPPSSRLPLVGITLFAFPAAGRRVARCLRYSRAYTLLTPHACIYRSHTRPLSHTVRFPRCTPRCISLPWRALLGSRPRRQDPPDYNVCVFSTSRGEPRSLALTRARISGLLWLLLGQSAACVDFLVLNIVTFRLFALCRSQLRETNVSLRHLAYFARLSRHGWRGVFRIESRDISVQMRAVIVRLQRAQSGSCFALILITGHCVNLCITLHTSRALPWKNSGVLALRTRSNARGNARSTTYFTRARYRVANRLLGVLTRRQKLCSSRKPLNISKKQRGYSSLSFLSPC